MAMELGLIWWGSNSCFEVIQMRGRPDGYCFGAFADSPGRMTAQYGRPKRDRPCKTPRSISLCWTCNRRVCGNRDVDAPVLRENTAALLPGRGKTWRHLGSCHFQTYLYARIPRVVCGEHGVRLPEHRIPRVGDLLLLRRVRSLPMLDLEVPLFRSRAEMQRIIK